MAHATLTADCIHRVRRKLAANSMPVPESGCWLWVGGTTSKGYGALYYRGCGRQLAAHRASWMVSRGGIPSGLFVCHKCDVRLCVNPDHLFLGSPLENMRDMRRKGRQDYPAGERHPRAKLTDQQVLDIRASGLRSTDVAKQYGISEPAASQILRRKTWAHLPDDGRGVEPPPRRVASGEQHARAKITAAQATAIYQDPRRIAAIAADYPVSYGLVRLIKKGLAWTAVTGAKPT